MRIRPLLLLLFLVSLSLLLSFNPTSLPAQTAVSQPPAAWNSLPGPTGGSVSHVLLTPDHQWDSPVFAAVTGHGIYRSLDDGFHWFPTGSGDWITLDLHLSPAFADDHTLFALTGAPQSGYTVRRSHDMGDTWVSSAPFANGLALAFSPDYANDQTLYLLTGSNQTTYLSTDGGDNFTPVGGWLGERDIIALAFSPDYATDQTLFALAANDGLYRSTDDGATWTPMGIQGDFRALALSPAFPTDQTLLAIDHGGAVYLSEDGGVSWTMMDTFSLGSNGRFSIAFSPTFASDRVVMVASSADPGPYRSLDGGHTWETAGWYDPFHSYQDGMIGGGVQSLALAPNQDWSGVAYAATRAGVARSAYQGSNWSQYNRGLPTLAVRALVQSPYSGPSYSLLMLAGSAYFEQSRFDSGAFIPDSGAIHRSNDGGQTWRQVSGRLARLNALALSPNFATDQTAFAAAGMIGQHGFVEGGLYRSSDGGEHWTAVSPAPHAYTALALSPNFATDRTVWAAATGATTAVGLYRSTNGGDSWSLVAPGLNVSALAVSPNYALDQTLFAGTGGAGVQRSLNGGLTWSQVLPVPQVTALAISPVYGASRTLYTAARPDAGAPTTLYRSGDGGATWQALTDALPPEQGGQPLTIGALAFAVDGSVLAGGQYGTDGAAVVYRSRDGGMSWGALPGLGSETAVYQLVSRPAHSFDLTAATGAGLFTHRLIQGGPPEPGSWLSNGPRGGQVNALAVSPDFANDGLAFAGERLLSFQGGGTGLGVRKSADYGQTWVESSGGMAAYNYSDAVFAYAFSPDFANDQSLFAATWGGLFHSADAGATWTRRPISHPAEIGFVMGVVVAPDFPSSGHMAAIAGYGSGRLYLSQDGGHTWSLPEIWLPGSQLPEGEAALLNDYIAAVIYSPDYTNDQTILISSLNGVWRSDDAGATWAHIHPEYLTNLAISPDFANDQTFWGGGDFLFIFQDGGATWTSHPVGESDHVLSLAVSPDYANDQTLFAGTDIGLYWSNNGGLDWTAVPEYAGLTISRLAISPQWPDHPVLLVGTPQGAYRLLTADLSAGVVQEASQGLAVMDTGTLALAPDESLLLAGTVNHGIFSSQDRGENWRVLGSRWGGGYFNTVALAISPDYANDQTIFAATASGQGIGASISRTQDGGENWVGVHNTDYVKDLAISPDYANDGVVFTAAGGYLRYSTDQGDTWTQMGSWDSFTQGAAQQIALSPGYPGDGRLLVGSSNGFWFSSDNGGHWTQATSGLVGNRTVGALVVSPHFVADGTLLATATWSEMTPDYTLYQAIFRSGNGGVDWALAMAGIPGDETPRGVAFSPHFATDQTAYALTHRALYRSRDGGVSWARVGAPPDGPDLRQLQVDSAGAVYISSSAGVWRYSTLQHNLIINGGFEATGGWTLPITPITGQISERVVYNGRFAAHLGLDNTTNRYGYSSARQSFTLPPNTRQATLTFHLYPVSGETALAAQADLLPQGRWLEPEQAVAGDTQYVLLLDPVTADVLKILHWELSNAQAWGRHTVSLPPEYAGRPLLLHFGVFNDGVNGRSALYVDDVSLTILDGALAPYQIALPIIHK